MITMYLIKFKNMILFLLVAFWMDQFITENRSKFLETLHLFLSKGADSFPELSKPKHLQDGKMVCNI